MNRRTLLGGFLAGIAAVIGKWTAPAKATPADLQPILLYERGLDGKAVLSEVYPIDPPGALSWSYQVLDSLNDPRKVVDFSDVDAIRPYDPERIHVGLFNLSVLERGKVLFEIDAYNTKGDVEHWHITSTGMHKIS